MFKISSKSQRKRSQFQLQCLDKADFTVIRVAWEAGIYLDRNAPSFYFNSGVDHVFSPLVGVRPPPPYYSVGYSETNQCIGSGGRKKGVCEKKVRLPGC